VGRGEMPSEHGDSWFSPKCMEVQPAAAALGGRALCGCGARSWLPSSCKLRMPSAAREGRRSESGGDNLVRREGNNPDHRLRSPRGC
jgi:hypothetical protein